jgi:hypothetical protein
MSFVHSDTFVDVKDSSKPVKTYLRDRFYYTLSPQSVQTTEFNVKPGTLDRTSMWR